MIQPNIINESNRIVHYTCKEASLFIKQEDFEMGKITKTLAHQHDDFECMQVISGGVCSYVNGKKYILHTGDIIFINANATHQSFLSEYVEKAVFNIILINQKSISNSAIFDTIIEPMVHNKNFACLIIRKNHPANKSIANYMVHMIGIQKKRYECYLLDLITYAAQLLKQIYLQYKHTYSLAEEYQPFDQLMLNQMVDFIYENYQRSLTLDDISKSANVSNSTACRLFKKFLQQSPINYLNAYRLEVGCQLLKNSDASISDIAASCGFHQQSYFNRLFRRTYAMTPLQYRLSDLRATQH